MPTRRPDKIASAAGAPGTPPFTFAYISDTPSLRAHAQSALRQGAVKAVEDVNALDPQPDFVLFGGDLAQLGRRDELELGRKSWLELKAPVKIMVGEHDWFFDMGESWQELFGPPNLFLRLEGRPLRRPDERS